MVLIRMPSLAENVNEATVVSWLVKEGDPVAAGQGVAEIVTEKAEFTLEAEAGGAVEENTLSGYFTGGPNGSLVFNDVSLAVVGGTSVVVPEFGTISIHNPGAFANWPQ